jgi:hypothetical protein
MSVMRPHAADIDISAEESYVTVLDGPEMHGRESVEIMVRRAPVRRLAVY